jgi:hypothetical protein
LNVAREAPDFGETDTAAVLDRRFGYHGLTQSQWVHTQTALTSDVRTHGLQQKLMSSSHCVLPHTVALFTPRE